LPPALIHWPTCRSPCRATSAIGYGTKVVDGVDISAANQSNVNFTLVP
jgi:hypothetical protein